MPDIDEVLRSALTDYQYNAAIDPAREVWCLACAGSGKSRTLAYRIAKLIADGAEPSSIVAFTFTEKAADSIKQRVAQALSSAGLEPTLLGAMYIGTIHSYCHHVLGQIDARYRQFDVLDENRLILYLISRYPQLEIQPLREQHRTQRGNQRGYFDTIKEVSNAWKTVHNELLSIEAISQQDATLGNALSRLHQSLEENQYIDFSLMIRLVVDALQENNPNARAAVANVKHLMVDEYQDVNPVQETLISALHPGLDSLFVVGDDDQAIYAWRGADVDNILTFGQRYPQHASHELPENFRSIPAIVETADNFVAQELGARRIAKNPIATDNQNPRDFRNLWFATRDDEVAWVISRIQSLMGTKYIERDGTIRGLTPADFAILMRSTREPEGEGGSPRHMPFSRALEAANIRYVIEAGGGAFERAEIRTLRDVFGLLRNGSPSREAAQNFFNSQVLPLFPRANFDRFTRILSDWGRLIHAPITGTRRRVFPQELVHQLLGAFGAEVEQFPDDVMFDLGVFSKIIEDVESVFVSVDSTNRFRDILNFLDNVADSGYDAGQGELTQRPDAVTLSTIHKVKGLEFPVVFMVDVEAQRFPKNRRSYNGWIPNDLLQTALNRGAYQSTPEEEARLFYTALTRAEQYLYISGSENLPGAKRAKKRSSFALRLAHEQLLTTAEGLPVGLEQVTPQRRLDENIVPTSYSEIKAYLKCPRDYRMRKVFGFSPPIPEMFGFGRTVHTAVAKLHELFPNAVPAQEEAESVARDVFHLKHIPPSGDPVNRPGGYERAMDSAARMTGDYVSSHREDFLRERQLEVRFEIPVTQAVIAGAIDLLLKVDEENRILDATVVDFKAVEGGVTPENNPELEWTDLSLQVQLYAKAAKEVLGENARTGSVHLLKDNTRVSVPVSEDAINAAVANVEWAVNRIIAGDFPMRPHQEKCAKCDFSQLCPKIPQQFSTDQTPPAIQVPGDPSSRMVRAFSEAE